MGEDKRETGLIPKKFGIFLVLDCGIK